MASTNIAVTIPRAEHCYILHAAFEFMTGDSPTPQIQKASSLHLSIYPH